MRSLLGLLAVTVLLVSACSSDDGGSGDADEGDAGTAQVMCREFIKDRLKSPSTADFSDESPTETGKQTWRVSGSVDSENGFGAMIRNDYVCTIRYAGDDNWRLVKLQGLNN